MSTTLTVAITALLFPVTATPSDGVSDPRYWAQWRGPLANGVAPQGDPPTEWSETKNIRWKSKVPGTGHASPIVWGDFVYVQTAIKTDKQVERPNAADAERGGRGRGAAKPTNIHQFAILAVDRHTGDIAWQKTLREEVPHEGAHRDGSMASCSPITDGERLYAYFGSRGLYCLDMNGELLWEKDFGNMHTRYGFGEGSSPALVADTLIVNWDHEEDSFIVALDRRTGKERWRKPRDEVTTWSTPFVVTNNGAAEVVVTATNRVRAYDPATGAVKWECGGLGTNCIPTPVAADELLFAMSGHREKALLAIRFAGAAGDISDSRVVWRRDKGIPYVPSPLLYHDALYLLERTNGILSCLDPKTGTEHYERQRLDKIEGVYASPVAAAGRVYIVGRNGITYVLSHGNEFKVLAINELGDGFEASPAIMDGELYLRGREHLYCITGTAPR